ncbi:thioredoxin domain-containing protein 16-like [Babylonia areolata]|uniref:thioredoxin domain-containing protein 16-like n=1 Tax=Babylonia areolata TaxID=304850 RepID=UPI003FD2B789
MTTDQLLWTVLLTFSLWCPELAARRFSKTNKGLRNIEDDPVLYVAARRRREKRLELVPHIPALTDKTFPDTAYNSSNSLVVVLFYLPFDAVGMLFLQQYQQAGRELASVKGGNSSSTHLLTRVNCYDWTDVCRKENVTTYPVIHLYQRGKWRQRYRDALDKDALVRSVFLLQSEQPLWLRTETEVDQFVSGHLPVSAHRWVDNVVILKPSAAQTEVEAFTQVVKELETQMLFAIVRPEVDIHLGIEKGVTHIRLRDRHRPHDTLTHSLEPESIRHFLLMGKFHLLPELTFRNFPELYARQQPLGILFEEPSHPESRQHVRALVDVIRSGHVHNVTFCTMKVRTADEDSSDMAERLLRTYTDQVDVPAFVIVDLLKRTVHHFKEWSLTDDHLPLWVRGVQEGKIPPSKHLASEQWRPVGRHIDFLSKMDRARERKEKADSRQDHSEHVHQEGFFDSNGEFRTHTSEDEEDEDEEEQSQQHHFHRHQYKDEHIHNQDQNQNNQNQHRLDQNRDPQNQNQNRDSPNENRHHQEEHEKNNKPSQNQDRHLQNQNQHERNKNQHEDHKHHHHHRKQNQHMKDQNQKRHRKDEADRQRNAHKRNQHMKHTARKLKEKTNPGFRLRDLDLDSDKEKKRQQPPPTGSKKSSRTLSKDAENGVARKGRDMKDFKLRIEL